MTKRLTGSDANRVNQAYKDVWDYVFLYFDHDPDLGSDAANLASAAAMAVQDQLVEMLTVDA